MATAVTRYVNTDSTAGGDGSTNGTAGATRAFATLNEAQGWLYTNYPSFVTSDVQVDVLCSAPSGVADTVKADFNTNLIVTDATRYLYVGPNTASDRALLTSWDTARYRLSVTNPTSSAGSFHTRVLFLTIDGLQIEVTGTTGSNKNGIWTAAATGGAVTIKRCRIRAHSNGSTGYVAGIGTGSSATVTTIQNCLIELDGSNPTIGWGVHSASTALDKIYNCTIIGTANEIGVMNGHATVAAMSPTNVLVYNVATPFSDAGGGWGAGNYNATDGTGAPGANSRNSQTFTFAGAPDYSLSSTDAGAREYGTDLSGSGVTIDMAGTTRPLGSAWDIGASEAAAAGGGPLVGGVLLGQSLTGALVN